MTPGVNSQQKTTTKNFNNRWTLTIVRANQSQLAFRERDKQTDGETDRNRDGERQRQRQPRAQPNFPRKKFESGTSGIQGKHPKGGVCVCLVKGGGGGRVGRGWRRKS